MIYLYTFCPQFFNIKRNIKFTITTFTTSVNKVKDARSVILIPLKSVTHFAEYKVMDEHCKKHFTFCDINEFLAKSKITTTTVNKT